MKHTLDVQVNDRKNMDNEIKSKDKQFSNEISYQINKLNTEKKTKRLLERKRK